MSGVLLGKAADLGEVVIPADSGIQTCCYIYFV